MSRTVVHLHSEDYELLVRLATVEERTMVQILHKALIDYAVKTRVLPAKAAKQA